MSHIVLLFGGGGSEHRVSVASAQNVAAHLPESTPWFWTRRGTILEVSGHELLSFERPFERELELESSAGWPDVETALDAVDASAVFFLALHGGAGEDGTVQGWLEARGLAFTGSGSEASKLAFDKARARDVLSARGVPVAEAEIVDEDAATHERLARLAERHEKLVLKPVADGSSHGMRILENERDLDAAILELRRHPGVPYLAEAFVSGRELTVGVVDGPDGVSALPPSEVRLAPGRTFDFEGKYLGKGTEEITPAEVPEDVSKAAQGLALTAHEAIGCEGYSRTDVILGERGPVFLEINTLPGLTKASFIPQQLEAARIPLPSFLRRQIEIAVTR